MHTTPTPFPVTRPRGVVPDPMLRLIQHNPAVAKGLPAHNICDMADELMARRAIDTIDAAAARRTRRADAIIDALRLSFTITGNPHHMWRLTSVTDVILDEVRACGFRDATALHVEHALRSAADATHGALTFATKRGVTVLQGLRAQGAAT